METQLHKFYQDSDILVHVEILHPYANIHVDIKKWTPSVARRSYRVFADLEKKCLDNGLTMISITPNLKFCELFGAKAQYQIEIDNKEYEVAIWDTQFMHSMP